MRAAVIDPASPGHRQLVFRFHKSLRNEEECRRTGAESGTNRASGDFPYREPTPGERALAA
jgi:hypothetical protein